jgi:hypothetical protein
MIVGLTTIYILIVFHYKSLSKNRLRAARPFPPAFCNVFYLIIYNCQGLIVDPADFFAFFLIFRMTDFDDFTEAIFKPFNDLSIICVCAAFVY